MNSLSDNLKKLGEDKSYFDEICQKCSLSDMKEIIRIKGKITIRKKFNDTTTLELVEKYSSIISIAECMRIYTYLTSVESTKAKSRFDLTSYVPEAAKAITVGDSTVTIHNGTKHQSVFCENGLIGGAAFGESLIGSMSVCTKTSVKKNKIVDTNFSELNEFAPSAALTKTAAEYVKIPDSSIKELEKNSKEMGKVTDELKDKLLTLVNNAVPTVNVQGKKQPIVRYNYKEKILFQQSAEKPCHVHGDYQPVVNYYNRYTMGTNYPAIKRIATNMWTGTPVSEAKIDHVIALHDAGVKVNDRVLVASADAPTVSLLRSNFGPNVFGVGSNGIGMISSYLVDSYSFDYIYYPKPLKFNTTGKFNSSVVAFLDTVKKKCDVGGAGKVICHVSPFSFYSEDVCNLFGVKYSSNTTSLDTMKVVQAAKNEEKYFVDDPELFEPVDLAHFQNVQPVKIDGDKYEYYRENPTLVSKLSLIDKKEYNMLLYGQLENTRVPMRLTQLSRTGTMLYCPTLPLIPFSAAIGLMITYTRNIFKSIWFLKARTKRKYKINKIVKGAIVESIGFLDDWSPLQASEVVDYLENKVEEFAQTVDVGQMDNEETEEVKKNYGQTRNVVDEGSIFDGDWRDDTEVVEDNTVEEEDPEAPEKKEDLN